jgi:bifunctional non-homologous end joining protein LigD
MIGGRVLQTGRRQPASARREGATDMSPDPEKVPVEVEGRNLVLTNLAKVLYPDTGFTKGAVIDYYLRIAPVLLPHIAGRPLTLKRYPDGVTGQHFYNKHAPDHRPDWVRTERLPAPGSTSGRDWVRYVIAGDLPTLIWTANLAGLELHTPMWRLPQVAEPDLLVFDLDPGAPATIVECCAVALWLRPLLAEAGLDAFAKTSGGKGLQLLAPLSGTSSDGASAMAKTLAEHLEREHPGAVVSRMTRSLRPGKVLVDWSQNNAHKTTIAPYSLRARSRPTVSTPVTWDEVARCGQPEDLVFTSGEVLDRVAEHGDLLAPLVAGQLS